MNSIYGLIIAIIGFLLIIIIIFWYIRKANSIKKEEVENVKGALKNMGLYSLETNGAKYILFSIFPFIGVYYEWVYKNIFSFWMLTTGLILLITGLFFLFLRLKLKRFEKNYLLKLFVLSIIIIALTTLFIFLISFFI